MHTLPARLKVCPDFQAHDLCNDHALLTHKQCKQSSSSHAVYTCCRNTRQQLKSDSKLVSYCLPPSCTAKICRKVRFEEGLKQSQNNEPAFQSTAAFGQLKSCLQGATATATDCVCVYLDTNVSAAIKRHNTNSIQPAHFQSLFSLRRVFNVVATSLLVPAARTTIFDVVVVVVVIIMRVLSCLWRVL